jgi:hypothetical protein
MDNPNALSTLDTQDTGYTVNIGHTGHGIYCQHWTHRTRDILSTLDTQDTGIYCQHWTHKTRDILSTLDTQDTGRNKHNIKNNTTQNIKNRSNTNPTKKPGVGGGG